MQAMYGSLTVVLFMLCFFLEIKHAVLVYGVLACIFYVGLEIYTAREALVVWRVDRSTRGRQLLLGGAIGLTLALFLVGLLVALFFKLRGDWQP